MNKRQKQIVEILQKQGEVTIHQFAQLLNVSEMTIHRDAVVLEDQGLLYKKRGALSYIEQTAMEFNDHYLLEKRAIAQATMSLIQDADSIIFDNSTTALEVAKLLVKWKQRTKRLAVYATNLEVANVVCKNQDITLYVSGGYYLPSSTGFVGSITEEFVARVHADKCIIGTSGISFKHGLTCPYTYHSSLEKIIIDAAKEVIVVADHAKFGKVALEKVADLDQVNYVVTDENVDPELLAQIKQKTTVLTAPLKEENI